VGVPLTRSASQLQMQKTNEKLKGHLEDCKMISTLIKVIKLFVCKPYIPAQQIADDISVHHGDQAVRI
jgi:hypothetical protein